MSQLENIMDDRVISYEDIKLLLSEELYQACIYRDIKTFGATKENITDNMRVWSKLRLKDRISTVLLSLISASIFDDLNSNLIDS